jgi:Fe-S-cluster-containing hydrogenase component 2
MAMYIVAEECINCGDCEPVCPTKSIKAGKVVFAIDAATCTECEGEADEPRCVEICEVSHCILPLKAA